MVKKIRKQKTQKHVVPLDVLSKKVRLKPSQLIDLIHRVNPTTKEYSEDKEKRLYKVKSRLQSLLIREYKDHITISNVKNDGQIVSLKYLDLDACHAVLRELDDDARSFAQQKLDENFLRDKEPSPPSRDKSSKKRGHSTKEPGDEDMELLLIEEIPQMLIAAEKYVTLFEFEKARTLFSVAFERSEKNKETALPFLTFLIENMGLYHVALSLQKQMPKKTMEVEQVRLLLAMAAARLQKTELCIDLLGKCHSASAGDVYLLLVLNAIHQEKEEQAKTFFKKALDRLDDHHPEIAHISGELEKLQEQLRKPDEEELVTLFAKGDVSKARDCATEIRKKWPQSKVANRILKQIQEQDRNEQFMNLVRLAKRKEERGDNVKALNLFEEASRINPDNNEIKKEFERLQELVSLINIQKKLDNLKTVLRNEDVSKGIETYCSLSVWERKNLQQDFFHPRFALVDNIIEANPRAKPALIFQAEKSILDALKFLAENKTEKAEKTISSFLKMTENLSQTQNILKQIKTQQCKDKKLRDQVLVTQTLEHFALGEFEKAVEIAGKIEFSGFQVAEKEKLEKIIKKITQKAALNRLERSFEKYLSCEDLIKARITTEALVKETEGIRAENWLLRQKSLNESIKKQWQFKYYNIPHNPDYIPIALKNELDCDTVNVWKIPGESLFFNFSIINDRIFITLTPFASMTPEFAVSYKAPLPLGDIIKIEVKKNAIWIFEESGKFIKLSTLTWDILLFDSLEKFVISQGHLDEIYFSNEEYFLWIEQSNRNIDYLVRIIDLNKMIVIREFSGKLFSYNPILGGGEQFMLHFENREGSVISPGGKRIGRIKWNSSIFFQNVLLHPNKKELLGLFVRPPKTLEETSISCGLFSEQGGREITTLEGSSDEKQATHALSRDYELAFVLYTNSDEDNKLTAFSLKNSTVKKVYEIDVPQNSFLLSDYLCGEVALLYFSSERLESVFLTDNLPLIKKAVSVDTTLFHVRVDLPFFCFKLLSEYSDFEIAFKGRLSETTPTEMLKFVLQKLKTEKDPKIFSSYYHSFYSDGLKKESTIILKTALPRFPGNPLLAYCEANEKIIRHDMEGVLLLLRSIKEEDLPEAARQHYLHLLGLALFHEGKLEESQNVWLKGALMKDDREPCSLKELLPLADAIPLPHEKESSDKQPTTIRRIQCAIFHSDFFIDSGEQEKALNVLNRPFIHLTEEVQSMARLVSILLNVPEENDIMGYQKAIIFESFLKQAVENPAYKMDLSLFCKAWKPERIKQLTTDVKIWLNSF